MAKGTDRRDPWDERVRWPSLVLRQFLIDGYALLILTRASAIVKRQRIRVKAPLSLEDARRLLAEFVGHYNAVRSHGAIGYVTPADKLAGREPQIRAERRRKLAEAEVRRRAAQSRATAAPRP